MTRRDEIVHLVAGMLTAISPDEQVSIDSMIDWAINIQGQIDEKVANGVLSNNDEARAVGKPT